MGVYSSFFIQFAQIDFSGMCSDDGDSIINPITASSTKIPRIISGFLGVFRAILYFKNHSLFPLSQETNELAESLILLLPIGPPSGGFTYGIFFTLYRNIHL